MSPVLIYNYFLLSGTYQHWVLVVWLANSDASPWMAKAPKSKAENLKWSWLIYLTKENCIKILFSLENKEEIYVLFFSPITTDNN